MALYHGEPAADEAEAEFDRVFKQHAAPDDIPTFDKLQVFAAYHDNDLLAAWDPAEDCYVPRLLKELGLVETSSEGRRKIDEGGVRLGGEQLAKGGYQMPWADVVGRPWQVGRRRWALVKESAERGTPVALRTCPFVEVDRFTRVPE